MMLLSALLSAHLCHARVSWRWGAGSQSGKALRAAGGTSVYETSIGLNGSKAELSVFSFAESSASLVRRLRSIFKDAGFLAKGGSMAFAKTEDGDTVLRMIVIQVSESSKSLLIKVEQSRHDYEASLKPPAKHLIEEVPEFPGSTHVCNTGNADTDFQIACSSSRAAPADIRGYYADILPAKGWLNPLDESTSLNIYMKEQSVCMVMATEPDKTGRSTITLLHKTHGVK